MKRTSQNYSALGTGPSTGPGNLLARVVAVIFGIGAFVLSLVVGAVFIAAIVGFMLLMGLFIAGRVWWIRRKMEQQAREEGDLRAEYTVIQTEERRK